MTTDNDGARAKHDMIAESDACPPNGTCYDLDDARRALADRPSLEAELAELRAKHQALLDSCPPHFELQARNRMLEANAKTAENILAEELRICKELKAESDRWQQRASKLEGALREVMDVGDDRALCPLCVKRNRIARSALAKMEGGGK